MDGTVPYGQKYLKKTKFMRRFFSRSGISPARLLAPYKNDHFDRGPSKFEVFRQVLSCQMGEECERYMDSALGGPELKHLRDMRTPVEYGMDLCLGWLKEDAVLVLLQQHGISVRLSGSDMGRDFLRRSRVRSDSDMEVSLAGKSRMLEVVYDASETWANEDRCDLRDGKLSKVKENGGLILGIDIINAKAFVYCPAANSDLEVSQSRRHRGYGNKPVYSIHGISAITVPLQEAFGNLTGLVGGGE